MDTLKIVLKVIFCIIAVILTIVVLMQEGKSSGIGALTGSTDNNTYWSKNKGRSAEGKLARFTKVLAIFFVIIAVVLNLKFW